jgi:hypothetical protein
MQKLMINATVMADDNLDIGLVSRLMAVLGQTKTVSVVAIHYRPREDRNATVWVYRSSDDDEPYVLVDEAFDLNGDELTEEQLKLLMQEGVCIGMRGFYPRSDRYGTPQWATDPQHGSAEMVPSWEGFNIAQEGFEAHARCTGDDSCESFWFQIALPETCELLKFIADKKAADDAAARVALLASLEDQEPEQEEEDDDEEVDARMQQLCDRVRRNMTEEEMTAALEGAGFAVSETGHDLVVAVAAAIELGDVSESVLDN